MTNTVNDHNARLYFILFCQIYVYQTDKYPIDYYSNVQTVNYHIYE